MKVCACGHQVREIGRAEVCIACFVRESTAAQGLPEKITDPIVLRDVAMLMTGGRPWRSPKS